MKTSTKIFAVVALTLVTISVVNAVRASILDKKYGAVALALAKQLELSPIRVLYIDATADNNLTYWSRLRNRERYARRGADYRSLNATIDVLESARISADTLYIRGDNLGATSYWTIFRSSELESVVIHSGEGVDEVFDYTPEEETQTETAAEPITETAAEPITGTAAETATAPEP